MQSRSIRIQRRPEMLHIFAYGKSTFHNRIKDGLIPPPISLGGRCVGWIEHETNTVLEAMISGRTDIEIKSIISNILKERSKRLK
jgi:prophage regulatory protein